MRESEYFELNGERILKYNGYYKCYTSAYARSTGLPMFGGSELTKADYNEFADKLLSKSRCKQIKKPVTSEEKPVAWYRVKNGYVPLYYRD